MNYIEEKNKNSKYLLFLLHGYTADKNDLYSLKDNIKKDGTFSYISVDAPFQCEIEPNGRQWFSLKEHPFPIAYGTPLSNETKKTLDYSADLFINFVEQKVKEYDVDYKNVYFLGFSQGTIMSFYSACHFEKEIGGIIACSGFICEDKEEFKKNLKSKPKVLFMYGEDDNIIQQECYEKSIEILKENNFDLTVKKYRFLGHSIDFKEIEEINKYV